MDRDWATLPIELLKLVVEKLDSPKEFSFVCKPWHSAAKDKPSHWVATTTPMVLIYSDTEIDKWCLYNPVDDKVLKTQWNLRSQRFCGSSKGWLMVVDANHVVSLINPVFPSVREGRDHDKSIIHLPPLSPPNLSRLKHGYYFVYKGTISEDPILNADNCIVMVIFLEMYQLAFLRLNKDSEWTYVLETVNSRCWRTLDEVVQLEDRFYAVDGYGKLFSFDVTTRAVSPVKVVVSEFEREVVYTLKRYLVVCNEKTLLMVQRCMVGPDGHETKKFRVFELCISEGEWTWTEKNSLGDVALFVGDNSSICVCASKSGYRANCIYFVHDDNRVDRSFGPNGAYDYGVYNVEVKRLLENPFHRDAGTLMSKTKVPPIWILPTYNLEEA